MRRAIFALCGLLLPASLASAAPPSAEGMALARKFGALESIQQASLSPDGNRVALIGWVSGVQVITIADLVAGGTPKQILGTDPKDGRLSWCSWATDTRLICQVRIIDNDAGKLIGFSRMIAINSDGTKLVRLSVDINSRSMGIMQDGGGVIDWDIAGSPGTVLMTREFIPEHTTGTIISHSEAGLGVEKVDTLTLKRSRVEPPRGDVFEYISDGHGSVRIMGTQRSTDQGYLRGNLIYFFRQPGSREWQPLSTVNSGDAGNGGFEPIAVDRSRNVVFGFDGKDGRNALYSIALDGSNRRELILARTDVDIDGLVRIGRDDRVVGATYATERRATDFFDPELKKLSAALGKALPGKPSVSVVDASIGESKLLLVAWSDTNPGVYYTYDKETRQLAEVLAVREELRGQGLAQMQPITYTAADGTVIPAYLTLPPGSTGKGLPAIVMPHGGPGARDEWGFDWLVQFFAARGYAVLQPNFRGSTGYGAAWYQRNGFKSWQVAIGDVNDAGRWLVKQGITTPAKLGIVGWSYGGYAALQSSVLDPDLYQAIVAIAPVTDLERLRQESEGFTNYNLVDQFIGRGAHVKEGSPAQKAAVIKAPVLLFHGTLDQNVGVGESRLMEDRLKAAGKRVTYVEFAGLDHQLGNAAARTRLLSESDAFLREAFGLAP
jgi:dipeptidyl aminopeptidase/acylaminoacyl peptidase